MNYQKANTLLGSVSFRTLGNGPRKILFFHGFPGSSAQIAMFNPVVESHELEVLCFDRPGYNDTTIETSEALTATATITNDLVALKNWDQFEIITVSGGTPFGITYAMNNQDRIKNIRVICGLGNFQIPEVRNLFSQFSVGALRILPYLPGRLLQKILTFNPTEKAPKGRRNKIVAFFLPASNADLKLFQKSNVLDSLNLALSEALRQNALGPQQDARAFCKDWTQNAKSLKIPLHFWHGDQDLVVPHYTAKIMSALFPKAGLTFVENEGHISLPINHIFPILNWPL